jgi:hypothetical protein
MEPTKPELRMCFVQKVQLAAGSHLQLPSSTYLRDLIRMTRRQHHKIVYAAGPHQVRVVALPHCAD